MVTFALATPHRCRGCVGDGISETISFTRATFPRLGRHAVVGVIWSGTVIWSTTNAST
jgi:hypothetical protein